MILPSRQERMAFLAEIVPQTRLQSLVPEIQH